MFQYIIVFVILTILLIAEMPKADTKAKDKAIYLCGFALWVYTIVQMAIFS